MQRRIVPLAFSASLAAMALASTTDGTCGPNNGDRHCTTDGAPCCWSGYCGSGTQFCGQGCRPLFSRTVEACSPLPVCQSKTYTFGTNGNARLAKQDAYTVIDGVNIDFVINVGEVEDTAEGAVLTLKTNKVGAKITSTRVLHHGKITFEIQTAWSGGVVTAAVLMGDATEEVDFEFTGNTLKTVQSNIFSNPWSFNDTHELSELVFDDTSTAFAKYSLDWSQDQMTWSYSKDSQERTLRTVLSKQFHIPQLPMYAQLAVWPGGESVDEGTRNWAGGRIDWNDRRFKESDEEFQLVVKSVNIECYDAYSSRSAFKYHYNGTADNRLSLEVIDL